MSHFRSWRDQNPPDFSLDWPEATYFQRVGPWRLLETGLRVEALLAAFQLVKTSPLIDPAFCQEFDGLLVEHADYLCWYLGHTDNNHAMMHMLGPLLVSYHLSDHPRATFWRTLAQERFELCLHHQVTPEGVHEEMTPKYHNVSADLFARPVVLAQRHGGTLPRVFHDRLALMARFTEASIRPDGTSVALGDSEADTSSAQSLALLGALLEDDRMLSLGTPHSEILWKLGPRAWQKCRGRVGTGAQSSVTERFAAGFHVMRGAGLVVFFDAAGMGGPHGHADALSFELSWNKTLLIPDPGRYTYEEGEWRRWFKGTAAHSTVEIDGLDQTPYLSTQAWGVPEAVTKTLCWESGPRIDYLVAEHNGYERLVDPVRCQRRLVFLKEEARVIVVDVLEAEAEHGFALRYQLNQPEGVRLHADRTGPLADVTMTEAGIRMLLAFRWMGGALGSVSLSQEQGWLAPSYGQKVPSPRLRLSGSFRGQIVLVTLIHPKSWSAVLPDPHSLDCEWDPETSELRWSTRSKVLVLGPSSCREEIRS